MNTDANVTLKSMCCDFDKKRSASDIRKLCAWWKEEVRKCAHLRNWAPEENSPQHMKCVHQLLESEGNVGIECTFSWLKTDAQIAGILRSSHRICTLLVSNLPFFISSLDDQFSEQQFSSTLSCEITMQKLKAFLLLRA